ncbi:MAG TPA: zinc ribbon domain-containing protein [Oscillospiraceae bacterium]|nr:zinc ribbon domain-containing protein [Oscillospiraceae bacterium]HPS34575.1 zinc ribbon domain-containing protein [Oscillospiraceae bacterium]
MKICSNCGTENMDDTQKFCNKCGYCLPSEKPTFVNSSSSDSAPATIDDCVKPDKLTQNLVFWSERLEKWGKILFWIIIIFGIIKSIVDSFVVVGTDYFGDPKTEFQVLVLFTGLITYGMAAFIEYLIYHALSLLIGALGSIVKHTRATALLTEFEIRKKHQ